MTTRKKQTRKSSKKRNVSVKRSKVSFLFSKQFLVAALLAMIAGVGYFLRETIVKVILEISGFTAVIMALWFVAIVLVVWRGSYISVLRNWNRWLAAIIFSLLAIGIMGTLRPEWELAGVSFADTTLSGSLGKLVAGESYTWARFVFLSHIGTMLIIPKRLLIITRKPIKLMLVLAKTIITRLLARLRTTWNNLKQHLHSAAREIPRRLVAFVRAKLSPSPESTEDQIISEPEYPTTTEPSPIPNDVIEDEPEEDTDNDDYEIKKPTEHQLPPIGIFEEAPKANFAQADDQERAKLIEDALGSYGVEVCVRQINPGPSVTQFGIEPGWIRKYRRVADRDPYGKPKLDRDGRPKIRMEEISKTRVKVEKILSLANDLALALAVPDIRIEAPVPGKALVGIEVPNTSTSIVSLRGVIESQPFQKITSKSKLTVALGQGAGGEAAVCDLAKMPHLLIAGATGSGKSVCLNCIVSCLLYQTPPEFVRLVLIDPKRVEMVTFAGVPHLIMPVVVDVDKAVESLRRVTIEMDNRYRKFAAVGARNLESYNRNPQVARGLPYLVVIIDELADLMMTAPDVVEPLICRLAQLSRATGIHLVVATQRPSVDVITGLIKANFPARISFAVVSSIDSRTILDMIGAEKLLGKGDMLYLPPDAHKPKRIRGCFVSDAEMEKLVVYWKGWATKYFPPEVDYIAQEFTALSVEQVDEDPLMEKARQLCNETSHVSASYLQRKLHIGYPRAARIVDQLAEEGIIDPGEAGKPWEGEP